ncbi:MAG: adenylate/guanylate cyclase domain-containing protein [Verrucomicrobiia bacterium]
MKRWRRIGRLLGIVLGAWLAWAGMWLGQTEMLRVFELASLDVRFRAEKPVNLDPRIILVAIDDSSIRQLGRWPWPREFHAALLQALNEYPPRAIGYDILMTEPDEKRPESDLAMVELCRQLRCTVFAMARDRDARGEYELKPFDALAKVTTAGAVNAPRDLDGVLRRLPMRVLDQLSFAAAVAEKMEKGSTSKLPDVLPIRFRGRLKDFRIVSAAEVLKSLQQRASGQPESFPIKNFLNSVVLVGLAATGTDVAPTPLDTNSPLVVAHANAVNNILRRDFLREAPRDITWAVVGLLCVVIGLTTVVRRPLVSGILTLCVAGGWVVAAFWLLREWNLWIELVAPMIVLLPMFAMMSAYRFFIEERDKRFLKKAFRHYLSGRVMEQVLVNPDMLKLGGERRTLTVLFSDVRGFTTFCEKNPPEMVVPLLNEIMGALSVPIREHDGTLDKYMGDAIMAFWGAPIPQRDDHALRAVRCALGMKAAMRRIAEQKSANGLQALRMGIGINSGDMTVGNMGSTELFDYTVIGDEVNLGARLESETRKWDADIIISETTYELVKDHIECVRLGETTVKGKVKPVTIYKVVGPKETPPQAG